MRPTAESLLLRARELRYQSQRLDYESALTLAYSEQCLLITAAKAELEAEYGKAAAILQNPPRPSDESLEDGRRVLTMAGHACRGASLQ